MGTTQVYFDTIQVSNVFGMQSSNNPGGPGTSEVQGVNPYLRPEGNDGNLVGFTASKAGDGNGNVGADAPPYTATNPLPNKLLLLAGDQQWGPRTYTNGSLPQYDRIPLTATITDLTLVINSDSTFADTWRLIAKISGTEYYYNQPGNLGLFTLFQSVWPNPATGNPWTRAEIFSAEWGYEIQTSSLYETTFNSHFFWPFYNSSPVLNVWYTWFQTFEMYLLVTFSDNNSVTITGSGGMADSGGLPGGGFDNSGLHLAISGGDSGGGGAGGSGHSAPTAGCPPDFPTGSDSAGGVGCGVVL